LKRLETKQRNNYNGSGVAMGAEGQAPPGAKVGGRQNE